MPAQPQREDDYSADRAWGEKNFKRKPILDPHGVRRKALARQLVPLQERDVRVDPYGSTDPGTPRAIAARSPKPDDTMLWVVGTMVAVGGGYLVGKWWRAKRQAQKKAKPRELVGLDVIVGAGAERNPYLVGADVLAT